IGRRFESYTAHHLLLPPASSPPWHASPARPVWRNGVGGCFIARVAELVDALDLGSSGATRESSSLSFRTIVCCPSDCAGSGAARRRKASWRAKFPVPWPCGGRRREIL